MKYIIQKLVKYSSINCIYVGSIVYLDIKSQKRRLLI
jgi:hypothetical protein